ncbi:MAG: hypothetical protein J6U17_03590 [Kiritimatiellae bacterium]|nr:hypothetical protein [Kiritimatiellia bacterium]
MNAITIYYYTAWNGYSWQGCDAAKASDLQRYMEAAGVLPGDPNRRPPFGGAIACQISGRMGVAVYRCGIRAKGDAFGRDSLLIALAFIPLECGPVDFAALLSRPEMSPSRPGELAPADVPLLGLSLPADPRRSDWREESFTERFFGVDGLRQASMLFFGRSCQLGLLQASFASETGDVRAAAVTISYRAFPEVLAVVEAYGKYLAAKRMAIGPVKVDHPARVALWDAVQELKTRRVEKMPGYSGLAEYVAAKEAELNSSIARASSPRPAAPARQESQRASATAARSGGRAAEKDKSLLPFVQMVVIVLLLGAFAVCYIISSGSHKKDVERLNATIKGLEEQCAAGESEKSGKDKDLESLNKDLSYVKGELERVKAENEEKVRQIEEARSKAEEAFKKEIAEYETNLQNATNALAQAKDYNRDLLNKQEAITQTQEKLRAELDKLLKEKSELEKQLAEMRKKLEKLEKPVKPEQAKPEQGKPDQNKAEQAKADGKPAEGAKQDAAGGRGRK